MQKKAIGYLALLDSAKAAAAAKTAESESAKEAYFRERPRAKGTG